ncbi:MAG: TonB-dependent receptor [Alphaproteobacteria bacterium]|nr:TonB-dependent receptor [Alphaproteobacteria bacterium]
MAGVSALGLGFGVDASAQQVGQPAANVGVSQGASERPAGDTVAGGEIVVTAQRRSENLMQTPIAAAVLSGDDLAEKGVLTIDSLQFAMPSVVVNNFGQGLEFNIRGIGKAETNSLSTTGVITYRDGVPSFPGYFQGEPYFDVANIQVLRGPQGTVVGQNSTGGAVFVNTTDPVIGGGHHGYVTANYGNYSETGANGAINLPIGDTFAARIALFGTRRDSFYTIKGPGGAPYTGNQGDVDQRAGRVSFLWRPTGQLSILSKSDFDDLDMGAYPADPFINRFKTLPGTSTPNPKYTDLFNITANAPRQAARDRFMRSILKIDYTLENGVKLRSITGYSYGNSTYAADYDGTATGNQTFNNYVNERQTSQEFNIISPDNQKITWLAGVFGLKNTYYFPEPFSNFNINYNTTVTGPFAPFFNYNLSGRTPMQSVAAFGQVGFELAPGLKLDLGGRYTESKASNIVKENLLGTFLTQNQTTSSHNFSYKASLGWEIDPNNYVYAFAATGFKPGGVNLPVAPGPAAVFKPETIQSFEGGWKTNFAGGDGRLSVAAFYNSYKNFQVSIGYPLFPTFGLELNVPSATKLYGIEAQAEYKLGGLTLEGGVSLLHSELGRFFATDARIPALAPCNPSSGPASASCKDLTGARQTYAPPVTVNVSAKYDFALGNGDTLTPIVNYGHVAAQWATLFENAARGDRLEDRNILGAQLVYQHADWTVTAYGTNLTDQHYVAAVFSPAGTSLNFAGPPRQYGIRVLKSF